MFYINQSIDKIIADDETGTLLSVSCGASLKCNFIHHNLEEIILWQMKNT